LRTAIRTIKSIVYRISDLSPEKKALSITSGVYLGLFPFTGITTVLCQIAIFRLKLNTVLVQSINLGLAPVQILLMYPMMKTGRILFYDDHRVIPEISSWFEGDISSMDMILYLTQTIFAGMVVWSIFLISTGYFFYRILLKLISYSE